MSASETWLSQEEATSAETFLEPGERAEHLIVGVLGVLAGCSLSLGRRTQWVLAHTILSIEGIDVCSKVEGVQILAS
jgi:hypothetical protein